MNDEHPELSHWLEIVSAGLMAVAVVGSAFSAWQATRWGGQQAILFAEASTARAQANRAIATAGQQISYDAIIFAEFAIAFVGDTLNSEPLPDANARNDDPPPDDTTLSDDLPPEVATLSDLLIREEFRPALDAWTDLDPLNNPDAPRTPFDLDEYHNAKQEEGEQLTDLAEANLTEGKEANQNGDDYILATVFFASVLFFAGIAPKFRSVSIRAAVLLMASLGLGIAITMVISLPLH